MFPWEPSFTEKRLTKQVLQAIIVERLTAYVEAYRSGHNGPDSKSGDGQPSVGSNPTASACPSGWNFQTDFVLLRT